MKDQRVLSTQNQRALPRTKQVQSKATRNPSRSPSATRRSSNGTRSKSRKAKPRTERATTAAHKNGQSDKCNANIILPTKSGEKYRLYIL